MKPLPLASPIIRWVVRHTLIIWAGVRVLVLLALFFAPRPMFVANSSPASTSELVTGMAATFTTVVVTVVLATADRQRLAAPVLLANMGYSLAQITAITAVIIGLAELALRAAVVVGSGPTA